MNTQSMITPREYQLEAIEAVNAHRLKGITRQLISLPTGCGKTIVFSLLAKEHNRRTLVLAHSEELIIQAVDKFKIVWPEVSIGIVMAENDDVHAQVVVASIQTASRDARLQKLKEQNFGLMIIDEAHHSTSSSYRRVIAELGFMNDDPCKLLVGVTATPKRSDGVGLASIFQEIVFDCSMSTMIRSGYLCPLVGKQVLTRVELEGVSIQNGDFAASELSSIVNTPARNGLIVSKFKELALERKMSLAFCADVKHAQDLAATFNAKGIVASAVYGSLHKDERKQILSDFSAGRIKILTNCMLLSEGFDEPSTDCVLLARPTKSTVLYTQQIGRGTRLFPMKRDCLILDFVDNSSYHNLCTFKNTLNGLVMPLSPLDEDQAVESTIAPHEEEIADPTAINALRAFSDHVEDIEFFDTAQFAWVPIGDSWHLNLAADRDVWVRKAGDGFLVVAQNRGDIFNLSGRPLPLNYALGVAEDWSRRQTTKGAWGRKDATWRQEPPTQKQLETLVKLGFKVNSGLTKGQAAQLIDSKVNEPATIKQVHWLKHRGINVTEGITKFEARKLIASSKRG